MRFQSALALVVQIHTHCDADLHRVINFRAVTKTIWKADRVQTFRRAFTTAAGESSPRVNEELVQLPDNCTHIRLRPRNTSTPYSNSKTLDCSRTSGTQSTTSAVNPNKPQNCKPVLQVQNSEGETSPKFMHHKAKYTKKKMTMRVCLHRSHLRQRRHSSLLNQPVHTSTPKSKIQILSRFNPHTKLQNANSPYSIPNQTIQCGSPTQPHKSPQPRKISKSSQNVANCCIQTNKNKCGTRV